MYLQDVHVENVASRGKSLTMRLLVILCVVLTVFFALVGLVWPVFFIVAILLGILAWFINSRSELDFDYSYTNGTIDIAKVFSKSSRKHFLTIEMKDVVTVGPVGSDSVRAYQGRGLRTIDVSSHDPGIRTYELVYHNTSSSNKAETIVLMDLDENFLDAMRAVAPSAVHKK